LDYIWTMVIHELIDSHQQEFYSMCKAHGVKRLFAFGSSVTEDFKPEESDIDLLVEIDEYDPIEKGEKLISLWNKLEEFFKRKVDLLTSLSIRNPYLKQSIDASKVLIYDASR